MNLPMTAPSVLDTYVKRVQQSAPGTFATGKGTTAKIVDFFVNSNRVASYPVDSIAFNIGVPSRQLSKRLAELVKKGTLTKTVDGFRHTANRAAFDAIGSTTA